MAIPCSVLRANIRQLIVGVGVVLTIACVHDRDNSDYVAV